MRKVLVANSLAKGSRRKSPCAENAMVVGPQPHAENAHAMVIGPQPHTLQPLLIAIAFCTVVPLAIAIGFAKMTFLMHELCVLISISRYGD